MGYPAPSLEVGSHPISPYSQPDPDRGAVNRRPRECYYHRSWLKKAGMQVSLQLIRFAGLLIR